MSNNNVKALKSSVWYIVANFLTSASAVLTTPVFTRMLTKAQYGMCSNYTSWQSVLATIFTFNVSASLISARYDYEDNLDQYIYSTLSMSSMSVTILAIMLNCFSDWTESFFSMRLLYINLMLSNIMLIKAFEMFQVMQRYHFKYKMQAVLSVLSTLASVVISMVLMTHMEDRLTGRIIGIALPGIVIGFCFYLYYIAKGRRIKFEYWKYALRICLPYIPHLLSMTILSSTDRIMITKMCGSADTALYSLAYSCGTVMAILLNSINSAYSPWLADRLHENDTRSVRRFSKYYVSAFVCVSLGIMLVAPEALYILGGEGYLSAIYVMPPVAVGCICQFLYTMFVNIEQIKGKTVGMAFASVSAALINYLLNLIFIPRFGYIAAAYTTLAGYLLLLGLHMFMVWKMGMSHVYSYRFILGTVLVVGVVMIGINGIYAMPIIRYAIILAYIAIIAIIIYRKRELCLRVLHALIGDGRNRGGESC